MENVELRGGALSLIGPAHHPTNAIALHFSIINVLKSKQFWKDKKNIGTAQLAREKDCFPLGLALTKSVI